MINTTSSATHAVLRGDDAASHVVGHEDQHEEEREECGHAIEYGALDSLQGRNNISRSMRRWSAYTPRTGDCTVKIRTSSVPQVIGADFPHFRSFSQ